ncbi:MAG: hypothetical protein HQL08_06935 [Nitrospirae bacterium]|nr:hypothetical protein [Nitrospirota bacterium]
MKLHWELGLAFVLTFFLISVGHAAEFNPKLSLSVSEQYNDNVYLQKTDRKSDFETSVSPTLDISLESGTNKMSINYTPGFNFYNSETNLNSTSHSAGAAATINLSDTTVLNMNDTFLRSSEITDLASVVAMGPVRAFSERTINNGTGNITFKLKNNLNLVIGGGISTSDIKGGVSSNSQSYTGNAGLNYTLSERTTISANAAYARYLYRIGNDSNNQNYGLGFTYKLRPTLTLALTGGMSVTDTANTGKSSNFSGSAVLTKNFEFGTGSLTYSQNITSSAVDNAPVNTMNIGVMFSRPFTESLAASLSGSYMKYNSLKTSLINTETLSSMASLTYKINTWANLSLNYTYARLHDKVNGATDYFNNLIMCRLTVFYGRKM